MLTSGGVAVLAAAFQVNVRSGTVFNRWAGLVVTGHQQLPA